MVKEYAKPMLDVGSPRVFNCNVLTQRILKKNSDAKPFFGNKPLNSIVLIKDTLPENLRTGATGIIGTKLYFPFNEDDVYEGGRTIFANDPHLEGALIETFGRGAISKDALINDVRILKIFDRLPSLDPFLLKDVFLNEKIEVTEGYFEIGQEIWKAIELFIVQRFEPVVAAAYPEAQSSDEKARRLIEKIWEARDLETLGPLIEAFRLPKNDALEVFAAWKGINFYFYQYEKSKTDLVELLTWLKNLQPQIAAISIQDRTEFKVMLDFVNAQFRAEWQKVDGILREYQESYDKVFKLKVSSAEFVGFLKNSSQHYWNLGNSLGKMVHAYYCWDVVASRFKEKKLPWEQLREMIALFEKLFKTERRTTTAVNW